MPLKSRRMKMCDAWCHSVGLYLCSLSTSAANEMFEGARPPTLVHRRIKAVFCHGSSCTGTRSSYTSFVDTTCGIFLFGSPQFAWCSPCCTFETSDPRQTWILLWEFILYKGKKLYRAGRKGRRSRADHLVPRSL